MRIRVTKPGLLNVLKSLKLLADIACGGLAFGEWLLVSVELEDQAQWLHCMLLRSKLASRCELAKPRSQLLASTGTCMPIGSAYGALHGDTNPHWWRTPTSPCLRGAVPCRMPKGHSFPSNSHYPQFRPISGDSLLVEDGHRFG